MEVAAEAAAAVNFKEGAAWLPFFVPPRLVSIFGAVRVGRMRRWIVVLIFVGGLTGFGSEIPGEATEALNKAAAVIYETSSELAEIRAELAEIGDDPTQQEQREVRKLRESELSSRLIEQKENFNEVATGVRENDLITADEANLGLMAEVEEIAEPLVGFFKEATAVPREMEELRNRKKRLLDQRELAKAALDRLQKWEAEMEGSAENEPVASLRAERLAELKKLWEGRRSDADGQLSALDVQLSRRESEKKPALQPFREAFGSFFRGRGLNLLKAIIAILVVWCGLRYLWASLQKLPFFGKSSRDSFRWRILNLSALVLTALLAAVAAMVVLYFSGDWLLLTLVIVLLAGMIWTAKSTIPQVFEQTKMLLNLGPVRKGERLTFEGIPWQVGSIGVYTELRNDELIGGLIRMSINRLSELRSRPHDESEAWFPSRMGDWLIVNDSPAKVVTQTPEYVQLIRLGGARETFPTADFLAMAPVNLSHNFRLKVTFGIDYAYQSIVTSKVPEIFKAKLIAGIGEVLADRDHLYSINVEFSGAGASSLDLDVLADFKGSAADRYQKLNRAIQRICVDVCNEQDWEIPFTQITVNEPSAAEKFAASQAASGRA